MCISAFFSNSNGYGLTRNYITKKLNAIMLVTVECVYIYMYMT